MRASKNDAPLAPDVVLPEPGQLARGLTIERVFSTEGEDPFESVEWETRDAVIKNPKGEAVFEQKGVEFPKSWSPLATNVVASKYFYGDLARNGEDPARGGRERSLRQLIHRVTRTITDWGLQQHYFATKEDAERFYDELTWLCLHQYGSFNSPVWFNVGLFHRYGVRDTGGKTIYGWDRQKQEVVEVDPYERPQASACFIISVDDSIDDIWKLMAESARLFKFGSGVGADWSKLRSSKEKLSGGGTPSGPVSFMRVQDATGGTIKSGGKTRRAAIMQTLRCWHPDIEEFVLAKQEEEKKAWALIEQGYDGSFNGPAYGSVAFQNVNQSVRVTDAFMQAVERGEKFALRAVTTGEVVDRIDAGALMKKIAEGTWICGDPGLQYEDTIQRWNTVKAFGPINSSNPCVTGDTLVATEDGLRRIDSMVGETPRVVGLDGRLHRTTRVIETGTKPVYRLRTQSGYTIKLTADHRVWTENRGDVPACELTKDDVVRLVRPHPGTVRLKPNVAERLAAYLAALVPALPDEEPVDFMLPDSTLSDDALRLCAESLSVVLQPVIEAGHVTYDSEELASQVQLMLLMIGRKAHREGASLVVLDEAPETDPVHSIELVGVEPVYDLTEPVTDHFVAGGIAVHNCSEFMHPDNTACNLASLNLRKFQKEDGTFDVERFRAATRIFITAMEILVDNAGYPSKQIAYNSHLLRPLGLGFANLGALLMAMGLPYDSDEGRAVAGAIMAIEHCEAYARSAEIAANKKIGPFPAYPENAESMLEVMRMHRAAVEDIHPSCPAYLKEAARQSAARMIALGERHGYRNAQATVLAPTGCLVGGSLVSTDRGLVRLTSLGDPHGAPWQDTSFRVFTDEGVKEATKFYVNGIALTRKIRTRSGYSIQGTHQHRIKVIDPETGHWVWKRFSDITPGDIVPMAMNTLIGEPREVTLPPLGELYWTGDHRTGVPRTVSPDLAELVGYFMGDGSLHAKGLRFCVSEQDEDVVARLRYLVETLFGLEAHVTPKQGYVEVGVHSVPLVLWWEACGFAKRPPSDDHTGKGYMPFIPDALLHTNDPGVYQAFLRGLFEADGTLLEGVPALCTAHEAFAQEIQSLLLALGYPTHTRHDQGGRGDTTYVLRLKNRGYNDAFAREIGFIGGRKREAVAGAATRGSAKGDRIYVDRALVEELVPAGSTHRDAVLLSLRRHGAVPRQRLEQIYKETRDERLVRYMGYFYDVVEANEDGGEQLTYDLSVPENVTYVANGFISHNTIAFMMDCDTTGIEPDIALVKYKLLAGKGDGMLKIVNRTVPEALHRLGYDEAAITRIIAYIDEHDTIEGAPDLKEEHLPVFDCAFKPFKGTRSIHHLGHLRMMAACQPFVSGAISKTINVPEEATVEDIADAYMQGWKLGLKAVAIYRENSKRSQPLSTSAGGNTKGKEVASGDGMATEDEPQIVEKVVEKVVYKPVRKRLPDERPSIAHKFSIAGHEGYLHIGLYPDTKMPGEIFITMAKQGSTISGLMDAFATSISLALQYGVPLEDLCNKFSHMRFEPSGFTNNRQIPIAKSIMDYIFRYLSLKFLGQMKEEDTVNPKQAVAEVVDRSGPATDEKQMDMFEDGQKPVDALVGSTVEAFFAAAERAHARQTATPDPYAAETGTTSFKNQEDAPPCPNCGSITVRSGACYACPNCGSSSGCG
ncbi:intein-containing adenosylcobalamin-dependent ribonucleoside-diphosphate reductase [Rhodocaloribacter litoris]|uniref:LAGLIDADG family homing endonuclease n=1 Tax=Rhodocaloribacter litoris TaxID=2558931 RepID=UPI00141EFA65|nr:LAGLIDADG family homing endonuclease [Rhodocaloribacter litoris]QXD13914.1 intein-containing adenosylcobalamin-dependent ribonucleoside-diphosphate reductase [Rhodocaloribacter litoris]